MERAVYRTTRQGNAIADAYEDLGLPQQMLAKRHERTNIVEADDEMHNYHRGVLVDHECEERFFEHEQPLDRRGANHSSRLNLNASGSKYGSEPYMPEVFLDEYYRDPNSLMYQPNMREAVEQSRFRVDRYGKWGKDADHSIVEKIRTGSQINQDRRDAFKPTQMRMKNFSTSQGNFNSHTYHKSKMDGISQATMIAAELHPELGLRASTAGTNHTVMASNTYPVGWQQNTDHIWNVAEYGARPYASLANADYNQQKVNHMQLEDHDPIIEFEGVKIPKSLVVLKKRHHAEFVAHDSAPGILPFEVKAPIRQHVQMKQGVRPPDGVLTHEAGKSLISYMSKQRKLITGKVADMINDDGKYSESQEGFSNLKRPKNANTRKALEGENTDANMKESSYVANYTNITPIRVNNHNSKVQAEFGDVSIVANRKIVKHGKSNARASDYTHKYGESHAEFKPARGKRELRGEDQRRQSSELRFADDGEHSSWRPGKVRGIKRSINSLQDNDDYSNAHTG